MLSTCSFYRKQGSCFDTNTATIVVLDPCPRARDWAPDAPPPLAGTRPGWADPSQEFLFLPLIAPLCVTHL
ncbi:hypothetical protein JTE90_018733 [Oedothorax gibbosus]|uniref:Uncharacterized protein n=1 Tax=Oedothorax gibbosus TaxID=931172 RepID=A0AAV6UKW2_9ARAC|nr:hypothetical protein JTE90_018733 [Oedothorax gibbosus]